LDELDEALTEIGRKLEERLATVDGQAELEALRVAFFGRSGEVTAARRKIGELPSSERKAAGQRVNDAALAMERSFDDAAAVQRNRALESQLEEAIDVTFPAIRPAEGSISPLRRVVDDVCAYFRSHGFAIVTGPEVEPDYYNFDALNIPPDHPAREGFDSFWLTDSLLLRPHTSPVQVRTMQQHRPPIAIIAPGRCYRRDAVDARHLFQFHQIEGLMVAEGVHFGHLKGMLEAMCRELFGPAQSVRFRPSFFPFTEPSAEVDTTCPRCGGHAQTCGMCGGSGWIELGGCGMVHPSVLRYVNYDPETYTGWAFGFGVERLALARYEIDDIRRFINSDPAFLAALQ
jgi:phenylalanyl-tRNA synthetase alpha chain